MSSVPVQKLSVPVVPAAAAVSEGDGLGGLQSRESQLLIDQTQKLRGWGSSAEERGHRIPTAQMTLNVVLLLFSSVKVTVCDDFIKCPFENSDFTFNKFMKHATCVVLKTQCLKGLSGKP